MKHLAYMAFTSADTNSSCNRLGTIGDADSGSELNATEDPLNPALTFESTADLEANFLLV
jgi:hypothetical protein